MMRPPQPVAQQPLRVQAIPAAPWVPCGGVFRVHVEPPLVVVRIVPLSPTTTQWDALGQETPNRLSVVPDVSGFHFFPPLVVRKITPPSPTVKHVWVLGHDTPHSLFVTPEVCCLHF